MSEYDKSSERVDLIADKMREHFPHVYVLTDKNTPAPKLFKSGVLLDVPESPNQAFFIASDVPYQRGVQPSNAAFFSTQDVMEDGILERLPSIIAGMKESYSKGFSAKIYI